MFEFFRKYPRLIVSFSEKKDRSMKLTSDSRLAEKISKNRGNYFEKLGIDFGKVVSAEIVHGNSIEVISGSDGGKIIAGADGLVSQDKNIYLSITSADCLPIFLFEPEKKIVGMVHAGWRSLEKNILGNAIGKIMDLGGAPQNILAGIGPAVCKKHYEVGQEVAEKFRKYSEAISEKSGKIYLDIKKIAKLQLLELGLKENNTETSPDCTFELPEKYFSARRDRPEKIDAMIGIIGIKSL